VLSTTSKPDGAFTRRPLTLSKLNHPHIATIYDFYSQEGTDYLVMEYIKGPTLGELLQEGLLPELEVLRLGRQIVEALVEAHDHGIVHRDLKPGNIIVTVKGQIKVLDFGLAKLLEPIGEDAPTLERTEKGSREAPSLTCRRSSCWESPSAQRVTFIPRGRSFMKWPRAGDHTPSFRDRV